MDYWSIGGLIVFFAALLLISTYRAQNSSKEDFFLGGRRLPAWALGMSFVATWYGGSSAIISTNEAFDKGLSSWWILGGATVAATLFYIFFAGRIRRTGALTQSEIVKKRYNKTVGNLLVCILIIWLCTWAASQMVILGQFIAPFIGLDYTSTVIICVLVALIYTTMGGFRAVVLTEMLQFALLVIGLATTMIVALYHSGGLEQINANLQDRGQSGYFNLFHDFTDNLTYIISFGTAFIIDAAIWQRLSAARTPGDARQASLLALMYFTPLYFMVVITGIAAVGLFQTLPEGDIVPTLMQGYMSAPLRSLVFLGVASAVLSTSCTALNACSMYMTELYETTRNHRLAPRQAVVFGRTATVGAAIIGIFIALRIQDALALLTLANQILAAGACIPIIGGFFWKRGTAVGAMSAIVLGGGFEIYNFLADLGLPLPRFWHGSTAAILIGLSVGLAAYVIVSLASTNTQPRATAT